MEKQMVRLDMVQLDIPEGRQWLKDLLKEQEAVVTFTKVSGDVRIMTCTLDPSVVPPAPAPKALAEGEMVKAKKENADVCSVWDINAQGWRSFRWANVTNVEYMV